MNFVNIIIFTSYFLLIVKTDEILRKFNNVKKNC